MKVSCCFIACLIASLFCACSDDVVDTSDYYFSAVEGEEDLLPATSYFPSAGETHEYVFDSGQDWTATLTGDDTSWLHLSEESGAAGVHTISLTADPNTGTADRTAKLLILAQTVGKQITIIQRHQSTETASRTVLIYMAGENSLNQYVATDLSEMIEGIGDIPEDSHLLAFVDDTKLPRIYELGYNKSGVADTVCVQRYTSELNTGEEPALKEALTFAQDCYPAESYGLVMWSHGEGWAAGATRSTVQKGFIAIDNGSNSSSSNSGASLDISEVRDAIASTISSADFILFDACNMQTIEVAYELRNVCHYMIGSPCEIPGPGAPYNLIVGPMFDEDLSDGAIANAYYSYYKAGTTTYGAVLSTIDCTALDHLAQVTKPLLTQYFQKGAISSSKGWTQYGFSSTIAGYSRTDVYLDFRQVMQSVLPEADYQTWSEAFYQVVLNECATNFWYSSVLNGDVSLNLEATGGVAFALPILYDTTDSSSSDVLKLSELKKMAWFDAVWSGVF